MWRTITLSFASFLIGVSAVPVERVSSSLGAEASNNHQTSLRYGTRLAANLTNANSRPLAIAVSQGLPLGDGIAVARSDLNEQLEILRAIFDFPVVKQQIAYAERRWRGKYIIDVSLVSSGSIIPASLTIKDASSADAIRDSRGFCPVFFSIDWTAQVVSMTLEGTTRKAAEVGACLDPFGSASEPVPSTLAERIGILERGDYLALVAQELQSGQGGQK